MCVRESGRSPEAVRSLLKTFFTLQSYSWTLPSGTHHTASKSASSRLEEVLLQSVAQKLDCEVGLRVAAKSSRWESRLSVDSSRR